MNTTPNQLSHINMLESVDSKTNDDLQPETDEPRPKGNSDSSEESLLITMAPKNDRSSLLRRAITWLCAAIFLFLSILVFEGLAVYLKSYNQDFIVETGLLDLASSDSGDATFNMQIKTPFTMAMYGYNISNGQCSYNYLHSSGIQSKLGDIDMTFHQDSDYLATGRVRINANMLNTDFRMVQNAAIDMLSGMNAKVGLDCRVPVTITLFGTIPLFTLPLTANDTFDLPQFKTLPVSTSSSSASQPVADAEVISDSSSGSKNGNIFTTKGVGINGLHYGIYYPLSLSGSIFKTKQAGLIHFDQFNVAIPSISYSFATIDIQNHTFNRFLVQTEAFNFDIFDPNANITSALSVICESGTNMDDSANSCTLPEAVNSQVFSTMLSKYKFVNMTMERTSDASFVSSSIGDFHFVSSMSSEEMKAFLQGTDLSTSTALLSADSIPVDDSSCLKLNTDNIYVTNSCIRQSKGLSQSNTLSFGLNIFSKSGLAGWMNALFSWNPRGPLQFDGSMYGKVFQSTINGNITLSQISRSCAIDFLVSNMAVKQFWIESFSAWNFSSDFSDGLIYSNFEVQSNSILNFLVEGSGSLKYGDNMYSGYLSGIETAYSSIANTSNSVVYSKLNTVVLSANGKYNFDENDWKVALSNSSIYVNNLLFGDADWHVQYYQSPYAWLFSYDILLRQGLSQIIFNSASLIEISTMSNFQSNSHVQVSSYGNVVGVLLWDVNNDFKFGNGNYSMNVDIGIKSPRCTNRPTLFPTTIPSLRPTFSPTKIPTASPAKIPTSSPIRTSYPFSYSSSSYSYRSIASSFCASILASGTYRIESTASYITIDKSSLVVNSITIGGAVGKGMYSITENADINNNGDFLFSFAILDATLKNHILSQESHVKWSTNSLSDYGKITVSSFASTQVTSVYSVLASLVYKSNLPSSEMTTSGLFAVTTSGHFMISNTVQSINSNINGSYAISSIYNSLLLSSKGEVSLNDAHIASIDGGISTSLSDGIRFGCHLVILSGSQILPLILNSTSTLVLSSLLNIQVQSYSSIPSLNLFWNANAGFSIENNQFLVVVSDQGINHNSILYFSMTGGYLVETGSISINVGNAFIQWNSVTLGYAVGSFSLNSAYSISFQSGNLLAAVSVLNSAYKPIGGFNVSSSWSSPSGWKITGGSAEVLAFYNIPLLSHNGYAKSKFTLAGTSQLSHGIINMTALAHDNKFGNVLLSNLTSKWSSSDNWKSSGEIGLQAYAVVPPINLGGNTDCFGSLSSVDDFKSGNVIGKISVSQIKSGHIFLSDLMGHWTSPSSWLSHGSASAVLKYSLPSLHYGGSANTSFTIIGDGSGSYANYANVHSYIGVADSIRGNMLLSNTSLFWESPTHAWDSSGHVRGSINYALPAVPYSGIASASLLYADNKYSFVAQDKSYQYKSKSYVPLMYANASGAYSWVASTTSFFASIQESVLAISSKVLFRVALEVGVHLSDDWSSGGFLLKFVESSWAQSVAISNMLRWSFVTSSQYFYSFLSSLSLGPSKIYYVANDFDISYQNNTGSFSVDSYIGNNPLIMINAAADYNQTTGIIGVTTADIAYDGVYLIGGKLGFDYIPALVPSSTPSSSPLIKHVTASPTIQQPVSVASFTVTEVFTSAYKSQFLDRSSLQVLNSTIRSITSSVHGGRIVNVVILKVVQLNEHSQISFRIESVVPSVQVVYNVSYAVSVPSNIYSYYGNVVQQLKTSVTTGQFTTLFHQYCATYNSTLIHTTGTIIQNISNPVYVSGGHALELFKPSVSPTIAPTSGSSSESSTLPSNILWPIVAVSVVIGVALISFVVWYILKSRANSDFKYSSNEPGEVRNETVYRHSLVARTNFFFSVRSGLGSLRDDPTIKAPSAPSSTIQPRTIFAQQKVSAKRETLTLENRISTANEDKI